MRKLTTHKGYMIRLISLILAFALLISTISPVFAQEAANQGSSAPATGAQADQNVQTQADQNVQTQADQNVQAQAATNANPTDVAPRSVTQENGVEVVRFDYQSSEVNVLVTLKNPEDLPADAVLSVTPVALDNTAQAKVDNEVKKDNRSIQSQKTFDIKFLQNGKEVEPGSTVKVTITLPDMPANTKAEVLHVSDDSQTVENTNAQTAADGKLQLETNSFSRYVIVNYAQNAIKVNVERYVLDEKKPNDYNLAKLTYRFDKEISGVGEDGTMEQVVTYDLNNYDCKKIVQVVDGKESDIALSGNGKVNIRAEKDMTLKLYYQTKTENPAKEVIFFDYDIDNGPQGNDYSRAGNTLINDPANFPAGTQNSQKIVMTDKLKGTYGGVSTGGPQVNKTPVWDGMPIPNTTIDKRKINEFSGMCDDPAKTNTTKGMLDLEQGLNDFQFDHDTGQFITKGVPNWGSNSQNQQLYDPGFFTEDNKIGKHIIRNFQLKFDQNGDHYHLADVVQQNGQTTFKDHQNDGGTKGRTYDNKEGFNFFPLDDENIIGYSYHGEDQGKYYKGGEQCNKGDKNWHNHYFGMRYDITFKLGDYVGDLNYVFRGDDDMWVILDGQKVVIDLGGIHSAADGKIDLWKVLAQQNGIDPNNEDAVKKFKNNENRNDNINNRYHCLTILYMERGGGRSNCVMDFTIPNMSIAEVSNTPKGSLSFNKVSEAINETTGLVENKPLQGATFSIKKVGDKDATVFADSDENGNVSFNNIEASDQIYEIKEEAAPTGYVTTQDTYYAKATLSGDATTVTVDGLFTDKECTQRLESNTVVNYPVKAYLDQKKTAKLYDWNERTYMINLLVGQHIPRLEKMDDAVITDVIDPRFEIIDKNGTLLKAGDHINADGIKDSSGDGVVSVGEYSGNQCYRVIWSNQSIPGLNKDGHINEIDTSTWNKHIYIRAKNEYVGGNNVPTNVYPDSNVVVNLVTSPFKQPKINVKPRLYINDLTKTVFAGDIIYHNDSVSKMFNISVDGSENGVAQCDMIGTKYESIASPTNPHLKMAWYADAEGPTATQLPGNTPTTVNSPSEKKYYLRAAYTFDTPEDASLLNSKEIKEGGDGKHHYAGEDENEAVSTTTDGNNGSRNNGATPTPTASSSNGSTGNTNGQTTSQSGSGEAFSAQSTTIPNDYYLYMSNGDFTYNGQTKTWGFVKINDLSKVTLSDGAKRKLYDNEYGVTQINSQETVLDSWNDPEVQQRKDLDNDAKSKVIDQIIVNGLGATSDYYIQFNAQGDDNYQGHYTGYININSLNSLNLTESQKAICKNAQ
ncbi:MAG: hypothetical protein IJH61_01130, partial [Eubacteriaceae bacterium]|nr:hypothetical protein [Eubacteriaceae bacterium]